MLVRRSVPILGRDRRPLPGSVSLLLPVDVEGTREWVLVRGVDEAQPLLLVVPDGPGETLIPLARGFQRELERAFVVANWDPRGAGLSYAEGDDPSALTLDRQVDDLLEVARSLCERFGRDRLVLAGHGFGSVVGLLAAARAPERFLSYLGISQWVEPSESARRSLAWVREEAERSGRSDLLEELERGRPDDDEDAAEARRLRWVDALGGLVRQREALALARPHLGDLHEYTLFDLGRRRRGIARSAATVGREARGIDLARRVSRLEVPAYFLAGRFDHAVDPELAREYLRVLDAPQKGWAWIEGTAHLAPFEDPDAYAAALAHYGHAAGRPAGPAWRIAG